MFTKGLDTMNLQQEIKNADVSNPEHDEAELQESRLDLSEIQDENPVCKPTN